MNRKNIAKLGAIIFFLGVTLILISWINTYPVIMGSISSVMFSQIYITLWPGFLCSSLGLFVTGYFSNSKIIKALCASFFPLIFFVYVYFFSYIPSSDAGTSISMVSVFSHTGIDPSVIPYFQYPGFFISNVMFSEFLSVNLKFTAALFFTLYGLLLGIFLFFIMFHNRRKNEKEIAFISVPIYFIAMFSFLNFQWVPQTLALVILLIAIYLNTCEMNTFNRNVLLIILFVCMVFTHAFIPTIYLLIFGVYIIFTKKPINIFLVLLFIYIIYFIYNSTFWFSMLVTTIEQAFYEFRFGAEYTSSISIRQPEGFLNAMISILNRIRVPIMLLFLFVGTMIKFFKKQLSSLMQSIGIGSGMYLATGVFFSVLGLRSLQIFSIMLLNGTEFYINKSKNLCLLFILILLMMSVSSPMRMVYDDTKFLMDEEIVTNDFLVLKIKDVEITKTGMGISNWGYFTQQYQFVHRFDSKTFRPEEEEFTDIFNEKMADDTFVIYNSNLVKEFLIYNYFEDDILSYTNRIIYENNVIHDSTHTLILSGN